MANHRSAEKAYRQSEKRKKVNVARKNKIKISIKKLEQEITKKDAKASDEALKKVQSELMRAASKGLIKKNAAARKISRLSAKAKASKKAS